MSLIRQESKLIRPFLHADEFKNVLSNVAICLKPEDQFSTQELHIIKPEDVDLLDPRVLLSLDSSAAISHLEKIGIDASTVRIVIILTSSELRLSTPINSFSLEDIPEQGIELFSKPNRSRFLSAKGGCEVSVAAILGMDLPAENLKPHTLGQWLAKKSFSFRPEKPSDDFSIRPLSEKDRLRLELPEGTVHFVEQGASLNDPEAKLQDCLTIWISEQIYNALSRDSSNRTSAAIQKTMLSEVILSVVISEVGELDPGSYPEERSPLDGFFDDLSKHSKISKERLVQFARPNGDKARLGAYIQQLLDLSSSIKSAL